MAEIETNYDHIRAFDIDTMAVYLSDINKKDVLPLDMKRWLESPYRASERHFNDDENEVLLENEDGKK